MHLLEIHKPELRVLNIRVASNDLDGQWPRGGAARPFVHNFSKSEI